MRRCGRGYEVTFGPTAVEGGWSVRKRVGEPVASVSIRWLVMPDDFDAAPGKVPPPTELDPTRSQRFCMLNGEMQFRDSRHSAFRAFGTGRTFPVLVAGRPQTPGRGGDRRPGGIRSTSRDSPEPSSSTATSRRLTAWL